MSNINTIKLKSIYHIIVKINVSCFFTFCVRFKFFNFNLNLHKRYEIVSNHLNLKMFIIVHTFLTLDLI